MLPVEKLSHYCCGRSIRGPFNTSTSAPLFIFKLIRFIIDTLVYLQFFSILWYYVACYRSSDGGRLHWRPCVCRHWSGPTDSRATFQAYHGGSSTLPCVHPHYSLVIGTDCFISHRSLLLLFCTTIPIYTIERFFLLKIKHACNYSIGHSKE